MSKRGGEHPPEAAALWAEFTAWIADLPLPTPREIFTRLGTLGYVGQTDGRRALALMAHRHVRRLKYLFVEGVARDQLPPKENHLLVGPTGCGKTFLVELLFRQVLRLPTALVDMTTFSETGYVGNDVSTILTRLLYAAELNLLQAQVGVVCLDEFDKLASGNNRAVFSGAGTTKDVTGIGVQRELLKLLERSELPIPTEFDHNTYQQKVFMRTDDIAFVACGAFSGLKSVLRERGRGPTIGFARPGGEGGGELLDAIAVAYDVEELEDTTVFQSFGFLPELMGRFARVVPFAPLDRPTLLQILREQVIPGRTRELALAGIELEVGEEVLQHVVTGALRRQTGARGLAATLTRHLEEVTFDALSEPATRRVAVTLEQGRIRSVRE